MERGKKKRLKSKAHEIGMEAYNKAVISYLLECVDEEEEEEEDELSY